MWRINVKFEKTLKLNSLYHLKNSNKISYEPWLKPQYYWPLSHGSNPHIIGLWAMAQTPIFLAFEPWLKHLYYWPLSHGSNIHIIGLWAMAQTNQLLDFEPWLKLINYWTLSHGSNSSIIGLWAMALTHQLLDFEPWLKPPKNRTLSHGSEKFPSHGSNPHFWGVWAMAQTHIWHADFNLFTRDWTVRPPAPLAVAGWWWRCNSLLQYSSIFPWYLFCHVWYSSVGCFNLICVDHWFQHIMLRKALDNFEKFSN